MAFGFSRFEGNEMVHDGKVQAFGLEAEQTENNDVGYVVDFGKTWKDFVKLEIGCPGVQ